MLELLTITLAAAEAADPGVPWDRVMAVGQLAYNGLIGLAMWWLKSKYEEHGELKETVKQQADQLVNERLKAYDHKLSTKIEALTNELQSMQHRLRAGETEFRNLHNADHRAELQLVNELRDLSKWFSEHGATKQDLRPLITTVSTLHADVEVLKERIDGLNRQAHEEAGQ